jgi:hypothetical protein
MKKPEYMSLEWFAKELKTDKDMVHHCHMLFLSDHMSSLRREISDARRYRDETAARFYSEPEAKAA